MPPFVPRKRRHSPTLGNGRHQSRAPASGCAAFAGASNPKSNGDSTPSGRKKRKTVFDVSEERMRPVPSLEETRAYLEQLQDESDESSELDSDEFEEVLGPDATTAVQALHSGDESVEFEDAMRTGVTVPNHLPSGDLELTLDSIPTHTLGPMTNQLGTKKGPSKIERSIRLNAHCMHVQCLLYHNLLRNGWLCEEEFQTDLVKSLPVHVKRGVTQWLKKAAVPQQKEQAVPSKQKQREWGAGANKMTTQSLQINQSDPVVKALTTLCVYWRKHFQVNAPGLRKQGWKDASRLEAEVKSSKTDHDTAIHGERIQGRKKFKELVMTMRGSRDVGAQAFVALLRGLGFETRLVASLQPIGFGWSKTEEALPPKPPKPKPAQAKTPPKQAATFGPKRVPSRKLAANKAGGTKVAPINLDDSESTIDSDESVIDLTPALPNASRKFDRDLGFPIYWAEVYHAEINRWLPVDPLVLGLVATDEERLLKFEPRGFKAEKARQVVAYIVAYSSDGTAKDVTVRYLKKHTWPGKTRGIRVPVEKVPMYNRRGKVAKYKEYNWFKHVLQMYERSSIKQTGADIVEDATDLLPMQVVREVKPGAEETLQGYKSSAKFVLQRHLRREEALLLSAEPVKSFRTGKGENVKEEAVYRRVDVVSCKTVESWHKEGREVKVGEQPLKFVPMRAVTEIRKREIQEAERESGEKMKQGLYSREQTDWIIPPPIKDGVIPKNVFGNMDVYVPSMVPKGAVHIPLRGLAKICKRLGIDHAEACTGFEFGNRRAVPVLTGVVVAKENEDAVIDAWETEEDKKRQREAEKKQKLALGSWRRFVNGLRIVERVKRQYGDADAESHFDDALASLGRKRALPKSKEKSRSSTKGSNAEGGFLHDDTSLGGGFVVDSTLGDGLTTLPQASLTSLESSSDSSPSLAERTNGPAPRAAVPTPKSKARANNSSNARRQQPRAAARGGPLARSKYFEEADSENTESSALSSNDTLDSP